MSSAVPDLVFLDLDRCIDPETGEPTKDDAARLLDACGHTYAEVTPSGAGVRIIGTAPDIASVLSRKIMTSGGLALEVYKRAARYLTVTGRRYREHPDALNEIGDVVIDMLATSSAQATLVGAGEAREDSELVRAIVSGEGLHNELCALATRYVTRGLSTAATAETLRGLMLAAAEGARDERWADRFASIDGLVMSAETKFKDDTSEARRAMARLIFDMVRSGKPAPDMRASAYLEARQYGLPEDIVDGIAAWVAKRERTRRSGLHG